MLDGHLGSIDGIVLVLALAVVFYWLVGLALRTRETDPMQVELEVDIPKTMPMRRPLA